MRKSNKSIFTISDKNSIEEIEKTLQLEFKNVNHLDWINEPKYKVQCLHCGKYQFVVHLAWDALSCTHCQEIVYNPNPEYPDENDIYGE